MEKNERNVKRANYFSLELLHLNERLELKIKVRTTLTKLLASLANTGGRHVNHALRGSTTAIADRDSDRSNVWDRNIGPHLI